MAVWILVMRGTSRAVEKIFLAVCVLYLSYVASAVLAKPDWLLAARDTVIPSMQFNAGYLLMLTALNCIEGITVSRDRKSTRLNSSHQIISYAVFCLKKKNNHCARERQ